MLYQFRFDLLFLFVFVGILFLNMTMSGTNKSDVQTVNPVMEQTNHNVLSVDNPVKN